MKRTILLTAVTAFSFVSTGWAADLTVKAPPPIAPAPLWTGWYVGLNLGYGFSGSSDPSARATSAWWAPAFAAGAAPGSFPGAREGVFGGGQIGYNWQVNSLVVWGLEADIQGSDIHKTTDLSNPGVGGFFPGTSFASQKLDWFGTVRGRVGVLAAPTALVYVTGGLAYGESKYAYNLSFPASNDFEDLSASKTKAGWTVGGGVEWVFAPSWSAKAEYLYVNLGRESFLTVGSGRPSNVTNPVAVGFDDSYHLVRVGVNYKFGPLLGR